MKRNGGARAAIKGLLGVNRVVREGFTKKLTSNSQSGWPDPTGFHRNGRTGPFTLRWELPERLSWGAP